MTVLDALMPTLALVGWVSAFLLGKQLASACCAWAASAAPVADEGTASLKRGAAAGQKVCDD
jgi:hypothetical protein